jgi:L-ascorbate metabolism protein UlaG (beta-lactamase superfamily)
MLEHGGIEFHWLGHDGFKIVAGGKTVYIDPYKLSAAHRMKSDADLVLISHDHFDHMSLEDLSHIVNSSTVVACAKECASKLGKVGASAIKGISPGEKGTLQGVAIEAIPAYNTNKTFHPKADGKLGFVITLANTRIYHCGDTDEIPEMASAHPDVALVPVSGTYVMTAAEAAQAVNERIKPKQLAIPMHYGSIVGSEKDAKLFASKVTACTVKILQQE